jgi:hypothetical protein
MNEGIVISCDRYRIFAQIVDESAMAPLICCTGLGSAFFIDRQMSVLKADFGSMVSWLFEVPSRMDITLTIYNCLVISLKRWDAVALRQQRRTRSGPPVSTHKELKS